MTHKIFETKSLLIICLVGFLGNMIFGMTGTFLPYNSYYQLLCFQLSDVSSITASVIAAKYTGMRENNVASAGFTMLGIAHGISFAASGISDLNEEKSITIFIPLIPTIIMLSWCTLFPKWVRVLNIIPLACFIYVYFHVLRGGNYFTPMLTIAYLSLMLLEISWAIYFWKDWRRGNAVSSAQ